MRIILDLDDLTDTDAPNGNAESQEYETDATTEEG